MPVRAKLLIIAVVSLLVAACGSDSDSPAADSNRPDTSSSDDDEPSPADPTAEPTTDPTGEPTDSSAADPTDEPTTEPTGDTTAEPTLPGGGRKIFPDYRLVGMSGGRSPSFGRLEVADLQAAAAELDEIIPAYESDGRKVLPVYELIAVIAHDSPTANGKYRTFEPDAVIQRYLDAAREHGAILLLNVQPGRADFLDDVKRLEKWLREPDVGVALDPEWAVGDGEVPGQTYGSTTGAELDAVASYVSDLVTENNLPEKVVVFHQVAPSVVTNEAALGEHPGVALVKSVDGIGARKDKEKTWDRVISTKPAAVRPGFKLFFEEDAEHGKLMTPKQVLALQPLPEYVLYE